jgi:glutathionyl-hydroquinone reductase
MVFEIAFFRYMSMTDINRSRIVPKESILDFNEQHDRDRFGT